ncbi:Hypothetical predicted protein, partial [Pelobates cultripes]
MEVAHAGKTSLVDLLWTPATYRPKDKSLLPTTKLTIFHWDKLRQNHHDTHKFHPRTPLTALKAISPWLSLHSWVKLGITHIEQVLHEGLIKPFPELQEEFKLTNSSVFPYLQLKSVLPTHVTQNPLLNDPDFKDIASLYDRCWKTPTKPKSISLCYQLILRATPMVIPNFVTQWLVEGA